MFVVIEGVDCTGKSTLANDIAAKYTTKPYNLVHHGPPTKHPLDEYVVDYQDYVPGGSPDHIVDRHVYGELVWPEIFGRKSQLDEAGRMYVEMFLDSRGVLPVHATRSRDGIEQTLAERNEPVDIEQIELAKELFTNAFNVIKRPHAIPYNFELLPPHRPLPIGCPNNARSIANIARAREERVSPQHSWTSRWVGSSRPHILLVGDQVNRPEDGAILPFVPYRGTSGHFLLNELALLPSNAWRDIALINSRQPNGELEHLPQFIESLRTRPLVVALGRLSAEILRDTDIEFSEVPHPQYVRRFERKQGAGYLASLIAAAVGKEQMKRWR